MSVSIEVSDLSKVYRGSRTPALKNLTFSISTGTIAALVGPNGAGKTTALECLLGLRKPSGGRCSVLGVMSDRVEQPVAKIGSLLGETTFSDSYTGEQHLELLAIVGRVPERHVPSVLERVGLTEVANQRVGVYSAGMKRRLGLAAALLKDPDVLILDEPLSALDPEALVMVRREIEAVARRGGTVLMSSHQLSEIEKLCDDVVLLADGELIGQGSPKELGSSAGGTVLVTCRTPSMAFQILRQSGLDVIKGEDDTLLIHGTSSEFVARLLSENGVYVSELRNVSESLESVYFRLLGGQ